ncbi:hypothetical protein EV378_1563 [Pseudonocardia endophytica]|uniref:CAAX prenyl protease 2/Lysostaphin resistance protein A-like domain-containing protein n=1 Tax=Pseudonocardia endophytica TaxID=401976 RepID=A0A4R1HWB2_PSEEN|nr:hypothetical protein EV378_1563 [Pseudonocardia endophytica]
MVTAVVLYAVGGALIFVVAPPSAPAVAGMLQFALSGLAPAGAFIAAVLVRIRALGPFGFRSVAGRWLAIAFVGAVVCLVVGSVLTLLSGPLFPGSEAVQEDYRSAYGAGVASLLVTLVLGGILTPIGEELLFRGLLASFLRRWGAWVTVIGSGVVFAVSHGINDVLPTALVVGLWSAWLFYRTRSIWPSFVVHITFNSLSILAHGFGLVEALGLS